MIKAAWVYILSSERSVIYIGVTSDLYRRVMEHRQGIRSGFAKKYSCHRLIYREKFADIVTAIAREKTLKGWMRTRKLALIRTVNPNFGDLAANWGKPFEMFQEPKL